MKPYFTRPFVPTTFRMPYSRDGRNVHSFNQFHHCPNCNSYLWYSPREKIFFCKHLGCYFVAEIDEMKAIAQPKIEKWNREYAAIHVQRQEQYQFEQARLEKKRHAREVAERKKLTSVVYYIEFGTRIKIGTTINIGNRMDALPWDRILLIEPGSYTLERQRHEQFADQHLTLEWFKSEGPLLDHIESRREELKEFNAARFPEQGAFPWVLGEVRVIGLREGEVDAILDPKWIDIPRVLV